MEPTSEDRSETEADAIEDLKDQARMLAAMARTTAAAQDEVLELRRALGRSQTLADPECSIDELQRSCAALEEECNSLKIIADQHRARADHFESRFLALQSSTSWRLTAPLRRVVSAWRAWFNMKR